MGVSLFERLDGMVGIKRWKIYLWGRVMLPLLKIVFIEEKRDRCKDRYMASVKMIGDFQLENLRSVRGKIVLGWECGT